MRAVKYVLLPTLLGLVACASGLDPVTRAEPEPLRLRMEGPPGATPGICWGRDTTPAIYETVTEKILLQPAEISADGTIRNAPVYKDESQQRIVRERKDVWFETPCAADLTPQFIASVQRALQVRGFYAGPVTGAFDARTRRAIRDYQSPQGLNSAILSTAAARQLGLVAVARDGN
ncbi:MAG: peptidoglycan-binding domain-containing protein [Pseudomonadota bacterium]